MFTILGGDGKEYGPVAADKIKEWIAAGRANLATRARRDGDTEWRTLGEFPEFAANAAAAYGSPPPPAPTQAYVVPAAPTTDERSAKEIADDLIARAAPLGIFDTIGRSFNLWTQHFLPLVGVTFVVYLIGLILGLIPIVGFIFNLTLSGALYAGLYYYYLGKIRGEPREFGDAFMGFQRNFGSLVLSNVFMFLMLIVAAAVLIGPWFLVIVGQAALNPQQPPVWIIFGMIACVLPIFYLAVSWLFASTLIIDRGLSPWTALEVSRRVVTKQWFRVFFTVLLGGIIAMLGVLGFIIGVVFTLPIAFAALTLTYESLFNPPPKA